MSMEFKELSNASSGQVSVSGLSSVSVSGPNETQSLFAGEIPVRLASTGLREEIVKSLRFEMDIMSRQPHGQQIFTVQITDESDPFFLFTLNVSETDFHSLKHEQNLLVDFATFPSKFIELLELCAQGAESEVTRYVAVLSTRNGASTLNIMETNKFKHLQHLALQFHPGNDDSVKKYLSKCVVKLKTRSSSLSSELDETKNSLKISTAECDEMSARLREFDRNSARALSDLKSHHAAEIQSFKEKSLYSKQKMQAAFEAERSKQNRESSDKIQSLETARDQFSEKVRKLSEEALIKDAKIRELSSSLQSHKTELSACKEDLHNVREECRDLEAVKYNQEKTMHKHLLRMSAMEQQVTDKDELASKITELLDSAKEQKDSLGSSLEVFKRNYEKSDRKVRECSNEIIKGNKIISHLQREINNLRARLKLKTNVIAQQDHNLAKCQKDLETAEHNLSSSHSERDTKDKLCEELQKELDERTAKVKESQKLLESNQQVISWLNKQVSEAELCKMQPPGGTSHSTAAPPVSSFIPAYSSRAPFSRGVYGGAGHVGSGGMAGMGRGSASTTWKFNEAGSGASAALMSNLGSHAWSDPSRDTTLGMGNTCQPLYESSAYNRTISDPHTPMRGSLDIPKPRSSPEHREPTPNSYFQSPTVPIPSPVPLKHANATLSKPLATSHAGPTMRSGPLPLGTSHREPQADVRHVDSQNIAV
eukprot:98000_1